MTPPEEHHRYREQIGAFLLGKLDGGERTAMQTHLNSCAVCQAEVRELEPVVAALADAAPDRIDEDLQPRGDLEELTLAPILGEIHRARRRRRRFRWSTQIAAAASVVVIGLAGFTLLDPEVSLAEDAVRLEVRMPGGELVFSAKLTGASGPVSTEGSSAEKPDPADTQKKPKAAGSGVGSPHKESPPESDAKRPSPDGEKPGAGPKESEPGGGLHEPPSPYQPPPDDQYLAQP
jgi:anti-sigma factor RsiW